MTGGKRRSSGAKAAKGGRSQFSSELVAAVLDSMIGKKMKSVSKNPRTVEKWLAKMKISLLKKISVASKTLFAAKVDYVLEFKNKQKEIDVLKAKVLENAGALLKQRLTQTEPFSEKITSHGFNDKVATMGKKISHMAHQLDSLNKDLQARVQSFGSTINVVESSVKEKAKSGPAYTSRSNSASARPAPTQVDTTSNAAMMLGDHLNQY